MKFSSVSFFLLLVCQLHVIAQPGSIGRLQNISPELSVVEFEPVQAGAYQITAGGKLFSSAVVSVSVGDSFDGATLLAGSDTSQLKADEHSPDIDRQQSIPIIFGAPQQTATVTLPNVSGSFSVYLIYAFELPSAARTSAVQQSAADCEEPSTVAQSEWRQGLSAPSYSRSYSEVKHLIVHHSATSNSLTDYYNVVRNIYVYHTQVNGWSDVGYNYLIAPDGTIFKGRDPGTGEQDLVLGAHFCGRNSGTMGVCLLGDFRSAVPKEAAISSLEALLTWKAAKDGLDVFSSPGHPLNNELPTIAGHRQGCATECPGDKVFERLEALRQQIALNIEMCNDPLTVSNVVVYPNPSEGDIRIEVPEDKELELADLITFSGQRQPIALIDEGQNGYRAATSTLKPGVYILMLKMKNEHPEYKKVILQ